MKIAYLTTKADASVGSLTRRHLYDNKTKYLSCKAKVQKLQKKSSNAQAITGDRI